MSEILDIENTIDLKVTDQESEVQYDGGGPGEDMKRQLIIVVICTFTLQLIMFIVLWVFWYQTKPIWDTWANDFGLQYYFMRFYLPA